MVLGLTSGRLRNSYLRFRRLQTKREKCLCLGFCMPFRRKTLLNSIRLFFLKLKFKMEQTRLDHFLIKLA